MLTFVYGAWFAVSISNHNSAATWLCAVTVVSYWAIDIYTNLQREKLLRQQQDLILRQSVLLANHLHDDGI